MSCCPLGCSQMSRTVQLPIKRKLVFSRLPSLVILNLFFRQTLLDTVIVRILTNTKKSVILETVSPTLVLSRSILILSENQPTPSKEENYRNSSVLSQNLGLNSRTKGDQAVSIILFRHLHNLHNAWTCSHLFAPFSQCDHLEQASTSMTDVAT